MRFLADESYDFSVVRALRSADHDVVAIAEVSPREEDDAVMERAVRGGRILLTEDKDFGQLVYAKLQKTGGVIFIRFPARVRRSLPATVVEVVRRRGQRLIGSFTVLQPGRVRTGPRPRRPRIGQDLGVYHRTFNYFLPWTRLSRWLPIP